MKGFPNGGPNNTNKETLTQDPDPITRFLNASSVVRRPNAALPP